MRHTARQVHDDRPGKGGTLLVIQGEYRISRDPDAVLATLLGSCVAACMHDPIAKIGGMNHFLLPGDTEGSSGAAERHGVHAMELLVNGLLEQGAARHRLEVKLFGGANTMSGLSDIGALNAQFAINFLKRERLAIVSECLRGSRGRRIQYWPVSGRARRIFMTLSEDPAPRRAPPPIDSGGQELF